MKDRICVLSVKKKKVFILFCLLGVKKKKELVVPFVKIHFKKVSYCEHLFHNHEDMCRHTHAVLQIEH